MCFSFTNDKHLYLHTTCEEAAILHPHISAVAQSVDLIWVL